MFKKIYLLITVCSLLLGPAAVAQTESTIPELNSLCWHKADCIDQRKVLDPGASPKELEEGWISPEGDCKGEDWGKCLPAGQTETSISFGGRRQFLHMGDFVGTMYTYAIGIAAVVAVLMIIVSGFQWALSGGNSETISTAKSHIVGAVIGLLIVYLSYFILNTLNPTLVSFRLPSVWMIKPQTYVPAFCAQLPISTKFSYATDFKDQASVIKPNDKTVYDMSLKDTSTANLEKFYCGHRFFVEGGGDKTCFGDYCPASNGKSAFCIYDGATQKYGCHEGTMFINITHNSLVKDLFPDWATREWNDPPVNKVLDLYALCPATTDFDFNITNSVIQSFDAAPSSFANDKKQNIALSIDPQKIDEATQKCASAGGDLKGFVLSFGMNQSYNSSDQRHFIGTNGEDLGDSFFFRKRWEQIPVSYFFTAEQLKKKVTLDIEAAKIKDISNLFGVSTDAAEKTYFDKFGISL